MNSIIDITGQRFGRLIALEPVGTRGASRSMRWRCRCDCGRETVTLGTYLRSGRTKSCGCTRGPQGPTGSRKRRPDWATEDNLRRIVMGPAARYLEVVTAYYRKRRKIVEISAATGLTKDAIAIILLRVRRAMGAKFEIKGDVTSRRRPVPRGDLWDFRIAGDGDAIGKNNPRTVPAMYNDTALRECILSHALDTFEMARLYWLDGLTTSEVAQRMGTTSSTVSLRLMRVKRQAENPEPPRYRPPVFLRRISL